MTSGKLGKHLIENRKDYYGALEHAKEIYDLGSSNLRLYRYFSKWGSRGSTSKMKYDNANSVTVSLEHAKENGTIGDSNLQFFRVRDLLLHGHVDNSYFLWCRKN